MPVVVHGITGHRMTVAEGKVEYWESLGYQKPKPARPRRKSKVSEDDE